MYTCIYTLYRLIHISPRCILWPILYYWLQLGITGPCYEGNWTGSSPWPSKFLSRESSRPETLLQGRGQEKEHCTHCRLGPGPQKEIYGVSGDLSCGTLEFVPEVVSEGFKSLAKCSLLKQSLDDLPPPRQRMAEVRSEHQTNLSPMT